MEPDETRPVDRNDYARLYAVLHALEAVAVDRDERPLWEILHDLHHDYFPGPLPERPVPLDDLIGDEAAVREVWHARLVAENLLIRDGRMSTRPTRAVATVCAVPGCPEPTYTRLCTQHELEEMERGGSG